VDTGPGRLGTPVNPERRRDRAGTAAPIAALVVLALVWGYNWVAIKVATEYVGPIDLSALRNGTAVVALFAALVVLRKPLRPTPLLPSVVLGLLQTTVFTLLQMTAVALGGAGRTAVLAYTMPFWVLLFAWPLLGERIRGLQWVAVGLAAIGLAFVLMPFDVHAGLAAKVLAIAGAVVWAASAVYLKWLRARYTVDLLALTAWQMLWGTIPLVALAALAAEPAPRVTLTFLAALGFIALPGTALAWLLWMFALSRLSAGIAGLASLATPVVGVLAAWMQLHEVPSATEWVGIACILGALGATGIVSVRAPAPAGGATRVA
jgi:drug/metabolite transporter (DMT)-like permease